MKAAFYLMLVFAVFMMVVQVHMLGPLGIVLWACIAIPSFGLAAFGLYARNLDRRR